MILFLQRGEHDIENELTFTNHRGYVFHDSRGFEAGDGKELKIVQNFVRRKSQEKKLAKRLHVIWFVSFGYGAHNYIFTYFSGIAFRWTMLDHH